MFRVTSLQVSALCTGLLVVGCRSSPEASPRPAEASVGTAFAATSAAPPIPMPPPGVYAARCTSREAGPGHDGIACSLDATVLLCPSAPSGCDPACASLGGECVWGGFGCGTVCARRTDDADKECTDSAECAGGCVTSKETPRDAPTRGKCRENAVRRGCVNYVEKGRASGWICAD